MITQTAPATVPELFADLPTDWDGWLALRTEVNQSREMRNNVFDHLADHVDESDHARRGIGWLAAGRPDRAAPELAQADGDLHALLAGVAKHQTGDIQGAREAWTALKKSSTVGVRAHLELLELALGAADLDEIEALVKSLGALDAPAADRAYAEGVLAEARGEHIDAIASWREALAEDPTHAEATFRLAYRCDLDGDDDEAIALYSRFRHGDLFPHAGALVNLGILFEDQGDDEAAVKCFRAVSEADPANARARRFLADAEASLDQYYDEDRERKADKQNAVLRIPVTDFELSVRARNCLLKMNIHTLGDLIQHTEQELLSFKNFGETSLMEIKEILSLKGLRLGSMTATGAPGAKPAAGGAAPTSGDVDVLDRKITELDLSVRSRAALATLGIKTLAELAQTTETTLLACRNFGQTSLTEIKAKLADHGLSLASK